MYIYIYIFISALVTCSFLANRAIMIALWRKITMAPRVFHARLTHVIYLINGRAAREIVYREIQRAEPPTDRARVARIKQTIIIRLLFLFLPAV